MLICSDKKNYCKPKLFVKQKRTSSGSTVSLLQTENHESRLIRAWAGDHKMSLSTQLFLKYLCFVKCNF